VAAHEPYEGGGAMTRTNPKVRAAFDALTKRPLDDWPDDLLSWATLLTRRGWSWPARALGAHEFAALLVMEMRGRLRVYESGGFIHACTTEAR
jgi:hypothetical protein